MSDRGLEWSGQVEEIRRQDRIERSPVALRKWIGPQGFGLTVLDPWISGTVS